MQNPRALVNPASKESVITVLQNIEQQCFASSERKWVAVMCDGVSYTFGAVIQVEFKECSICLCFVQNGDLEKHVKMHEGDEFLFQIPFNRIHLRPGPGHIEMNIARLLLSLLWVPFIKDLANDLGFRTPNVQQVFKNGIDHHIVPAKFLKYVCTP